MNISETILMKIRNYGALKYTPDKICDLLGVYDEERELLLQEFDKPGSQVSRYFRQGIDIGDYNIDAELAKKSEEGDVFAVMELGKRQYHRGINNLKKDLFGI